MVQLPGREARWEEPCMRDLDRICDALASAVQRFAPEPCYFFGHSLGALLAFETCRKLRRSGCALPHVLMVSARPAPQLPRKRPPVSTLPKAALFEHLVSLGGMPQELLEQRELLDFFEPILRADLALNDCYRYVDEPPLPIPVVVFSGADDRSFDLQEMAHWRALTHAAYHEHSFPGDHFFINQHRAAILELIAHYASSYARI
jgi:medium-chain acyl-[acyl-carrier-protein] hydrolase